ncbi:hypothetical protein L3Q82_023509 [Scortum barcoo]|uniref:Uncharacterized protein n=1 Tax=Scortum barcoo TaxID=214431 RepID=A0ACB8WSD2_9TELE|nr:hypothetical protein L3Q82_023509 [Scortum barcoo]
MKGSGLRCYKCSDYTGQCQNVQECTNEDACISLSESGGKTIRQCIKNSECNLSYLPNMFPSLGKFNYNCCTSNLCNAGNTGNAVTMATPILALVASLLSVWWCWS